MTQRARHLGVLLLPIVLLAAACQSTVDPSPMASETAEPSSPGATVSGTPEPTDSPSATPVESTELPASPTPDAGGFAVLPNAEADALFLQRDGCENRDRGWRLAFPDAWWTNTAFGDLDPCSWFSPTAFDVTRDDAVPAEVAIVIRYVEGPVEPAGEELARDEGYIGITQSAVRLELGGDGDERPSAWREYAYIVQLGPTPAEGPNLYVRTASDMGGDYELNKAVLDRIMATMELLGSID